MALSPTVWNTADQNQTFLITNSGLTITSMWRVLTIAYDIDAAKAWVLDGSSGLWNNDVLANQNPANGTGGYTPTGLASGAVFPMWSGYQVDNFNTDSSTFNFGASTIINLPSGFSTCNTAAGATVTLDPANKHSWITLSGGDLTATMTTSAGVRRSVKATHSFSSGKICYEVFVRSRYVQAWGFGVTAADINGGVGEDNNSFAVSHQQSSGTSRWRQNATFQGTNSLSSDTKQDGAIRGTNPIIAGSKRMFEGVATIPTYSGFAAPIGIASSSADLTKYCGGDAQGYGWGVVNSIINNYWTNATPTASDGFVSGATIGVYVDDANKRLWFYDSTTGEYNSSPTADPATNTGGLDYSGFSGLPYPMMSTKKHATETSNVENIFAANFAGSFTSPVPSGFVAWDAVVGTARSRGYIIG